MKVQALKGELLLLLAALIWGTGFVFQKLGMNYVGPLTFGAVKFLLGAAVLIPVIIIFNHINKKKQDYDPLRIKNNKKDLMISGSLCGLFIAIGTYFQQLGLIYTTVGKAGFITALYIVLVPIFGLFLHKRAGVLLWIGVGLATVGLYFLCIKEGFTIQKGDAIELCGTVFWALQILTVDAYVARTDPLVFSCLQLFIAGILSTVAALIFEEPEIGAIIAGKVPVLYAGIVSIGIATSLQVMGQRTTEPAIAAITFGMESVFAVISGALFLNEIMSLRELMGCGLMFTALVMTQLKRSDKYPEGEKMINVKKVL